MAVTKENNHPLRSPEIINIFQLNLSLATKALRVRRVLMEDATSRHKTVSLATKILNNLLLCRVFKVKF
jgi:hypothetical protein